MLKGIAPIISPELMKTLMEMGHGDEIVIADGNFPAAAVAKRLIRCDGHGVLPLLTAVLPLFPLDTHVKCPVMLMQVSKGDVTSPPIWADYQRALDTHSGVSEMEEIERFAFYERAKEAYAVVATSEAALYANIILKKGTV